MKPLAFMPSLLFFAIPSVYFFMIGYILIPFLVDRMYINPLLSWVTGGFCIFVPLFLLPFIFLKAEGCSLKWKSVCVRLRLKNPGFKGWMLTAAGTLLTFLLTGLMYFIIKYAAERQLIQNLNIIPPFLRFDPLRGNDRWILCVWFPMFFFNIIGEELLWRGYMLPRQEAVFGKYTWLLQAFLWMVFHFCFGPGQIAVLLPILFILPYIAQKTQSTIPGILIHGLLNGPMFIVVSLGIIG